MRKIFTAFILAAFMCGTCLSAEVNPDAEIHRVMGGLYSLSAAVAMNGELEPSIGRLRGYFANVPGNWQDNARIERLNGRIWAGVPVGKYSTARHYLRSKAQELGIMDSPGGSAWMGGDYAWLKAADIVKGKLRPSKLRASMGSGSDSSVLFFSATGQSEWWEAYPTLTRKAAQEAMRLWGEYQSDLRRPQGVPQSIYESVKPSAVEKPEDMHTSRKKNFIDSFDMDLGDVIFRPIPGTGGINR